MRIFSKAPLVGTWKDRTNLVSMHQDTESLIVWIQCLHVKIFQRQNKATTLSQKINPITDDHVKIFQLGDHLLAWWPDALNPSRGRAYFKFSVGPTGCPVSLIWKHRTVDFWPLWTKAHVSTPIKEHHVSTAGPAITVMSGNGIQERPRLSGLFATCKKELGKGSSGVTGGHVNKVD